MLTGTESWIADPSYSNTPRPLLFNRVLPSEKGEEPPSRTLSYVFSVDKTWDKGEHEDLTTQDQEGTRSPTNGRMTLCNPR